MPKHNKNWRIACELSDNMREEILRELPPSHAHVYCRTITFAYGVPADFRFQQRKMTGEIYGFHAGDGHESLLVSLDGQTSQADGTPLHITLSVEPHLPPAAAKQIDLTKAIIIPSEQRPRFSAQLRRLPLRRIEPEIRAAA